MIFEDLYEPLCTPAKATEFLRERGWILTYASRDAKSGMDGWSRDGMSLYVSDTGDCELFPVRDSETDARTFRVRVLIAMIKRHAP